MADTIIPSPAEIAFALSLPAHREWTYQQMKAHIAHQKAMQAVKTVRHTYSRTLDEANARIDLLCDILEAILLGTGE